MNSMTPRIAERVRSISDSAVDDDAEIRRLQAERTTAQEAHRSAVLDVTTARDVLKHVQERGAAALKEAETLEAGRGALLAEIFLRDSDDFAQDGSVLMRAGKCRKLAERSSLAAPALERRVNDLTRAVVLAATRLQDIDMGIEAKRRALKRHIAEAGG
jgi:hypothetical protein